MRASLNSGFSLVEVVVALGLMLVVTAAIFDLVTESRRRSDDEPEIADRQQRIRVAVDTLHRDLLMATLVMPYRAVGPSPDPGGTFKSGVVTVVSEKEPAADDDIVRTYYVRPDLASGASQLMRADGSGGDAPVVDGVTTLSFEYFGDGAATADAAGGCSASAGGALAPIAGSEFTDGPWCLSPSGAESFDADLLRVRKVAVRIGVQRLPEAIRFEVALRNRNQDR
jgi:hypothetical protein